MNVFSPLKIVKKTLYTNINHLLNKLVVKHKQVKYNEYLNAVVRTQKINPQKDVFLIPFKTAVNSFVNFDSREEVICVDQNHGNRKDFFLNMCQIRDKTPHK